MDEKNLKRSGLFECDSIIFKKKSQEDKSLPEEAPKENNANSHESIKKKKKFQIVVKTATKTVTCSLYPDDNVLTLKHALYELEGYPVTQQMLLFDRNELRDGKLLSHYNMLQESTVHLFCKFRGNGDMISNHVIQVSPRDHEANVPVMSTVVVRLDHKIQVVDSLEVLKVIAEDGSEVKGTISLGVSGAYQTITFVSSEPFKLFTSYNVHVKGYACKNPVNNMVDCFSSKFTTEQAKTVMLSLTYNNHDQIKRISLGDYKSFFASCAEVFNIKPDDIYCMWLEITSVNIVIAGYSEMCQLKDGDRIIIETRPKIGKVVQIAYDMLNLDIKLQNEDERTTIGAHSFVYKGIWNNQLVSAQKHFPPKENEISRKDIEILGTLNHPKIVNLLAITEKDEAIYTISEYMPQVLFLQTSSLIEFHLFNIAQDIADGLAYLHDNGVIHGSLKSLKILLSENKEAKIKIRKLPSGDDIVTIKDDIYDYGKILYEIETGRYCRTFDVQGFIHNSNSEIFKHPALIDIARLCTSANACDRPSAKELQKLIHEARMNLLHIDSAFICPISHKMMEDPVIASDGISYERKSIEEVYNNENKSDQATTKQVKKQILIPNKNLKISIQIFKERNLHKLDPQPRYPIKNERRSKEY